MLQLFQRRQPGLVMHIDEPVRVLGLERLHGGLRLGRETVDTSTCPRAQIPHRMRSQ
jgi:hypothetical protein